MNERTGFSLADNLLALAASQGDRPALEKGGAVLSFSQLAAVCAQTAHELRRRDLHPGAHIGIALRDNVESVIAMFGVWMAGAVAVPIDFRAHPDERRQLCDEFDLSAILEDRAGDYPGCQSVPVNGDYLEKRSAHPSTPPEIGPAGAPALISLTSGTTGRPLGFVYDHLRLLSKSEFEPFRHIAGCSPSYSVNGVTTLNCLPLSFSAARTHTLLRLLSGGKIVMVPPLITPSDLAEAMRASRAAFAFVVPTIVRGLLDQAGGTGGPLLPDMRILYIGGANLTPDEKILAQDRLTTGALTAYASTASGTVAMLLGEDMRRNPDTEGRVLSDARIEVVSEDGVPLPEGETGILRVRAPGMANGIYGGRERSQGDRIRGGWVYPGDLGAITEEGFLRVTGRQADLIIRGGANVYPAEIENVVRGVPGVSDCAAVGFGSAREGQEIAVFVVAAAGRVTEADVIAQCRRLLGPDKRPRRIAIVESLPRNANGKVLRRDLAAALEAELAGGGAGPAG